MFTTTRPKKSVVSVEAALDETGAGSFPASDPPSSLPNPDEHDAEGSGVERAEDSRPAPQHPRK
jgi:hypothetical protein